ncbi:MAG: protease pro-enzyme activation domain-containing protein, partial [Rhodospirillales bacterium]
MLMAAGFGCTVLAGAATAATTGLTIVGKPEAASAVSFEVALPLRNTDKLEALLKAQHDPASPQYHRWLTPAQFGAQFGPDAASVNRVAAALRARGLNVQTHTRSLHVSGSASLVENTLGTHLQFARSLTGARGHRVVTDSALRLPTELSAAGATVMSFGEREMHVMSRVASGKLNPYNRNGPDGGYWYNDLKQAYQYPSYQTMVTVNGNTQRLDGTGATIGVLMSSDYLPSDVKAMFDHEQFSTNAGVPDPTLFKDVAINGGGGLFGGAFDEVSLDTQEEITGAPGAHVILYDIPDLSDDSVFGGYVTAIEANEVDLISASFGGCETTNFPKYNNGQDFRGILRAYHELFLQGNAQGITFLASSGDEAGKVCPNVAYFKGEPAHYVPGVSWPADDPNVTGVGGTNVVTVYEPGSLNSAYAGENAWLDQEFPNDPYGFGENVNGAVWGAGGGVSSMWPAPSYQSLVTTTTTKRADPDVGMQVGGCPNGASDYNAKLGVCNGKNSPKNGYGNTDRSSVAVAIAVGQGGGFFGLIGTSVASPEFAGAMALLIEQQGRMGNLNEYLYRKAAQQAKQGAPVKFFHTNIPGYNGVIQTNVNATYSFSTGVGTPVVKALVGAGAAAAAGLPRTPSNP